MTLTDRHLILLEHVVEGVGDSLGLTLIDLLLAKLLLGEGSSVWVEAELHLEVLERVLLLYDTTLADGSTTDGTEDLLDIAGVDDLAEVGLAHDGGGQEVVLLERGGLGGRAVDLVKSAESG
jgi:hypothetical protein